MALTHAIFSGTAIIISYIISVIFFNQLPTNTALTVFGLSFLIVGVCCNALSKGIAERIWKGGKDVDRKILLEASMVKNPVGTPEKNDIERSGSVEGSRNESDTKKAPPIDTSTSGTGIQRHKQYNHTNFSLGVVFSIICGTIGATTLVPLHYIQDDQAGFVFLPAFGTSALVSALIALGIKQLWKNELMLSDYYFYEASLPGILSGCIWNLGNIMAIGVIPILGYGVAFPIIQCSIFFCGAWGIFLFKEYSSNGYVVVFFSSALVMIAGAIMLSIGNT